MVGGMAGYRFLSVALPMHFIPLFNSFISAFARLKPIIKLAQDN